MIRPVILLLCLASCAAAQSTMTAPVGKYPALNVQVTVGTQERAQPGYYIFGLRDPGSKKIIDFKTNDSALAELGKAHPEKRDDLLDLAKGAKFPAVK